MKSLQDRWVVGSAVVEGMVGDQALEGMGLEDRKWWKENRMQETEVVGIAVICNDKSEGVAMEPGQWRREEVKELRGQGFGRTVHVSIEITNN